MEILDLFGVNLKAMLAQLVNFLLVAFILWQFVIKGLIKNMNSRSGEISAGLENAQKAKDELAQIEKQYQQRMAEARQAAEEILVKAQNEAQVLTDEAWQKTVAEKERLLKEAQQIIKQKKDEVIKELRQEIVELSSLMAEKILKQKLENINHKK